MQKLKLKNTDKHNIKATTFSDNKEYTLKPNEELILGDYSDSNLKEYCMKYLYKGLELVIIEE